MSNFSGSTNSHTHTLKQIRIDRTIFIRATKKIGWNGTFIAVDAAMLKNKLNHHLCVEAGYSLL